MWYLSLPLMATVVAIAAAQSAPPSRMSEDVARIAAAATNDARFEAVVGLLRTAALPFTVERFTIDAPVRNEPRTEGRNIVVTVGNGTTHIVVGAHYDAMRLAEGSLSRGAVDNAASSVLLTRLAQALPSEKLGARVSFVWFDMEELGLRGSREYVRQHGSDGVSAMINFDINAYGDTILFGPSRESDSRGLRRIVVETCAAEDATCVAFPEMPPGDDRSFTNARVPTVSLAILPAVEAHQLWLLINNPTTAAPGAGNAPAILQTIHTAADTADKVSDESMEAMLRFAVRLVRTIAERL
jgi:Zn-dependent M28 family amino/carboxypeptidase